MWLGNALQHWERESGCGLYVRWTYMFCLGSEKKRKRKRYVSFKRDMYHSKMSHSKMYWDVGSVVEVCYTYIWGGVVC